MTRMLALILGFSLQGPALAECPMADRAELGKEMLALKLGPAGLQNGSPNPMGLPPGPADFEFTYTTACGTDFNLSISPGLTVGHRYRFGEMFFSTVGTGLIIEAQGAGPGIYSGFGVTMSHGDTFVFEADFKQALGLGGTRNGAALIMPYALRIGMGYLW